MFPTVARLPDWVPPEQRAHPEARFYLYFAAHHGACIHLAWAAEVESPDWRLFNIEGAPGSDGGPAERVPGRGVLDIDLGDTPGRLQVAEGEGLRGHVSSPELWIDDENQRFLMVMHGAAEGGQKSFVATSATGLNFNPAAVGGEPGCGPLPFTLASSVYLRLFRAHGQWWAIGHSGRLSRPVDPANPWSRPHGAEYAWETLDESPLYRQLVEAHPGREFPSMRFAMRHGAIRMLAPDRELELFYGREFDDPERIMRLTLDISSRDWSDWRVKSPPAAVLEAELPWEGDCLHDAFVYMKEDGSLLLFYTCQEEDAIAVARLRPI